MDSCQREVAGEEWKIHCDLQTVGRVGSRLGSMVYDTEAGMAVGKGDNGVDAATRAVERRRG